MEWVEGGRFSGRLRCGFLGGFLCRNWCRSYSRVGDVVG